MGIASIRQNCEHMRGHVQTLNASRVVTPYMARCRLPLTTTLRAGTRATYRSRFLGAYGHRRPTAETTFPDAHPGLIFFPAPKR